SAFIRRGFNLGRAQKQFPHVGLALPIVMLGFLVLMSYFDTADGVPVIRESAAGPGSLHAALGVSLTAGLAVGFLAQRTRFCTIGGMRDAVLIRDFHLLLGVLSLVVAAFLTNFLVYPDQWNPGWDDQPLAHGEGIWNFLGMALAGLAFVLAGGCPGRQLVLSGEGDSDAATFVVGMIAGAAFAHNFFTASGPTAKGGVAVWGPNAVVLGLAIVAIIGLTMRQRD
ncbi:MAG: YedE-related selenium metabolism membrane protein, partial [Thermoplasmata archaeon]|nr:YedE-related selenium metabolism membrane protein [Thermoplasmata archaeon]